MLPKTESREDFLERLPLGVVILDAGLTVKNANRRALELLGLGIEDLLLESAAALRERLGPLFRTLDSDGAKSQNLGLEVLGKFLNCTASFTEEENEAEREIILLIEDRTDSRRLEALKEEFLSTLLHRLRSPLTTLKTSLSVLSAQKLEALPPMFSEVLAMCSVETSRLNVLLDDLRDAFYIETGLAARELEMEPVEVSAALDRAVGWLWRTLGTGAENVARVRIMAPGSCKALADYEKLSKIFYRLLKNALQFSAPGTPVDVRVRSLPGQAVVEVCDHGAGIPAADLSRMFEKYFRGTRAGAPQGEGNGLGLFISKSLVELMGGSLYCESREGEGSIFHLTLPTPAAELTEKRP